MSDEAVIPVEEPEELLAPQRRFQSYLNYQSSDDWYEGCPAHWTLKRLKHVSRTMSGGTPSQSNPAYWGGEIPWVSPKDMGHALLVDTIDHITELGLTESSTRIVPPGSVFVVVRSGILAHTLPVAVNAVPMAINQDIRALVLHNEITSTYLRYLVQGKQRRLLIEWTKPGTTVQSIETPDLVNTVVPIPPLPEQRAIAAFLDRETARIDELIAEKRRLIELLAEKRTVLIGHAVTKGLNPDAPMKESAVAWFEQIPQHWDALKFRNIAFFQEGPGLRHWQFTDSGIRVVCVTNITDNGVDFTNYQKFISEDEYRSTYTHFTVQDGDILLSSSGNSWGKVAEFRSEDTAILNTSTIRVNENTSKTVGHDFIKWCLQSSATREQLGLMMTGSCQPNFGPSHLSQVVVPVPPATEQREIVDYLSKRVSKIEELCKRVDVGTRVLREYRCALISAAVTGKIDLRREA